VFGAFVGGDFREFGIELVAGAGEGGDLHGQERDHETAGTEGVEGVDLVLFISPRVAFGAVSIIQASGEEEHGGGRIEFHVA